MLRTGMNDRHTHLYRPQKVALLRKLIRVEPFYLFHGQSDRVDTFVAGSMSGFPYGNTVEHHQPFFSNGRLHARRLSDNGEGDRR